jgi:hypothetical protein
MNRWIRIAVAITTTLLVVSAFGCRSAPSNEPQAGANSVTAGANSGGGGKPVSAPLPPGATGTNSDTFVTPGGK